MIRANPKRNKTGSRVPLDEKVCGQSRGEVLLGPLRREANEALRRSEQSWIATELYKPYKPHSNNTQLLSTKLTGKQAHIGIRHSSEFRTKQRALPPGRKDIE